MLIQSGSSAAIAALAILPWVALELTSERSLDENMLHLVRWAVSNLESASPSIPFQILYPLSRRAAGAMELLSPYLWMRTPSPTRDLRGITRIQGMQGIVRDHANQPITATPEFMDDLIARCRSQHDAPSAGIAIGSGVRILVGNQHGLCGIVERFFGDTATDAEVRIALRSRAIRLRIPVGALQNLGHAPKDYFEKEEL